MEIIATNKDITVPAGTFPMVELEFKLSPRRYISHRFHRNHEDAPTVVYQLRKLADEIERQHFKD
jgi:hypothetical protein